MSYPSGLPALALDVLGRVEAAGWANARLLALCPAALGELRSARALRRWIAWREVSPAARPLLADVWWETVDRLPEAAAELAELRRLWRSTGRSFEAL